MKAEIDKARRKFEQGFTLLELLIVLAIIAILSVIILFAINPVDILKKSRDNQRLADMASVATAANLYLQDVGALSAASATSTYFSWYGGACDAALTAFTTNGATKVCPASASAAAKNDATGWIPVDFTAISTGPPISKLPIDPKGNDTTYYYRFGVNAAKTHWKMDTVLEYYTSKHDEDGGPNAGRYEVGNNLKAKGTGAND